MTPEINHLAVVASMVVGFVYMPTVFGWLSSVSGIGASGVSSPSVANLGSSSGLCTGSGASAGPG